MKESRRNIPFLTIAFVRTLDTKGQEYPFVKRFMKDRLLLSLHHRQFFFSLPKLLIPYFRHNRRLFSLEGGFDENGRFVHIPLENLNRISEYFHRLIIKFFLNKQLLSAKIATSLIHWRHSGFSIGSSVHIPAGSSKTREALSQ